MSFLSLYCSAVMDFIGGEFNRYKSKCRTDVKYFKLVRIQLLLKISE